LDSYNKVCDDTVAGPTASFSYQADGDATVQQADDIENVEFVYISDDETDDGEGDQPNPKLVQQVIPDSGDTGDDGDSDLLLMQVLEETLTAQEVIPGFPNDVGLPAGGGA
jgi:hypothetical protein